MLNMKSYLQLTGAERYGFFFFAIHFRMKDYLKKNTRSTKLHLTETNYKKSISSVTKAIAVANSVILILLVNTTTILQAHFLTET